jgi:hypothetical protein
MKTEYHVLGWLTIRQFADAIRGLGDGWRLIAQGKTPGSSGDEHFDWLLCREEPEPVEAIVYEMRLENVFMHHHEKVEQLAADGWHVVSSLSVVDSGSPRHNVLMQRRKPPGCDHDWEDGFSMNGPTRTCRKCGKWERD